MRLEQFDDAARGGEPDAAKAPAAPVDAATPAERLRIAAAQARECAAAAETEAQAHRAARERAETLCNTLAETVAGLRVRIEALTAEWAGAVGEAARACLPCLAASGFAAEVAGAALAIARRAELPRIVMRMAPALHDTLADRLAGQAGAERLVLEPDAALPEGRVLLEWEDGGALIDRARLERAAQDVLARHLAILTAKDPADERA